jgi:ATP-grasp domain
VKPTVLVSTTSRWLPTARLAVALANAGFVTHALCPTRHPLSEARTKVPIHLYNALTPLTSVANAIRVANPDLIVSGDDLATQHLHNLYHEEYRREKSKTHTCELIEDSLGTPDGFPIVTARAAFMRLAKDSGVRVPETQLLQDTDDLLHWIRRTGLPIVLKANGTSGGVGVKFVHNFQEAERAFRALQAPPLLSRATKRAIIDKDMTLVWPSLLRRSHVVNAQQYIPGREATSLVACWKGAVLASLHFEVLNKRDATGPSTVLRLVHHPEMSSATETLARRLQLSGLHGFDFILEGETSNAYLIEINPRATQVGHLTLGAGRDLPAALFAAVSGEPLREATKLTDNQIIVLFPQEWLRNAASVFLQTGYHDVPWDEADWIKACVAKRKKQKDLHSQFLEWNPVFAKARRN